MARAPRGRRHFYVPATTRLIPLPSSTRTALPSTSQQVPDRLPQNEDRAKWPDLKGKSEDQLEFEKGYRRLKMEMRRDGFDSSLFYYLYKMSTTLMICLFSAWLVAAHPDATTNHFAARCWGGGIDGHLLPAVRLALPRDLPPPVLQE